MQLTELFGLLGKKWSCECGRVHEVPTRSAIVEPGALKKVPQVMNSLGLKGRVFLLADETTFEVAGKTVSLMLEKAGLDVRLHILKDKPHADDVTADGVVRACETGDSIVVSCGSGTVTDLAKWVAFKKNLPHVAVATAPSMNGYASGIVALTRNGLKTTDKVRPPVAVIADIDILKNAPIEMIHAGLGDLISKSVCNADWRLASIVRGEHFCRVPFRLIQSLEKACMDDPALINKRDPKAIIMLTWSLIFSGISMVIAGSSAPASGGEHLISHFIDMRAALNGKKSDLHGAQVGVATIATARIYEKLFKLSLGDLDVKALSSLWDRSRVLLKRCEGIFGDRSSSIVIEYESKLKSKEDADRQARAIINKWDEIKLNVKPFLLPADTIRSVLEKAHAKSRYSEIGLSSEEFKEAIEIALCIRNRYTVLDLAFAVGAL